MTERDLERRFYHDLLNLASSLRGIADVISDVDEQTRKEMLDLMGSISETMIETIHGRRYYRGLEANDLVTRPTTIDAQKLFSLLLNRYRRHALAKNRSISITSDAPGPEASLYIMSVDRDLFLSSLGFGIRAALEAAPQGGAICVGLRIQEGAPQPCAVFSISLPGALTAEQQDSLFQKPTVETLGLTGLSAYTFYALTTHHLKGEVHWRSQDSAITLTAQFACQIK